MVQITKPERQTERIVVYMTPSQAHRLQTVAEKHGVPVGEVVRQAVEQFLGKKDSK
jgi:hypothetical protein